MKKEYLKLMNDTLAILPFKVPQDILIDLFNNDKLIKKEVMQGGIDDSEERYMFLDKVLNKLTLPAWPIHGIEDNQWTEFLAVLRLKAKSLNINMDNVEIDEQKRLQSLMPIHNVKIVNDLSKVNYSMDPISL